MLRILSVFNSPSGFGNGPVRLLYASDSIPSDLKPESCWEGSKAVTFRKSITKNKYVRKIWYGKADTKKKHVRKANDRKIMYHFVRQA